MPEEEENEQHYEHFSLGNIMQQADDFLNKGDDIRKSINLDNLKNVSNDMYKMLLIIAIIVAVIVGAILGIKFIIAGAEGKAEIKEAIVPYVVGCIVVFSAFTIWSVAYNTLERISDTKSSSGSDNYVSLIKFSLLDKDGNEVSEVVKNEKYMFRATFENLNKQGEVYVDIYDTRDNSIEWEKLNLTWNKDDRML